MSAPNANAPNEGIVGQAINSVSNAANYVAESVMGTSAEAKKEAGKSQAQDSNQSIGNRLSGAGDAISGKMDESKHDASAEANKQSI